jgi:murein peptide amidase A
VEGRAIEAHVRGSGRATVLLLATIHGDETAGTPLLHSFLERSRSEPAWLAECTAIVVPTLNPDGVARGTRRNANDVDLNRNFPAANRLGEERHGPFPLSEAETRFLARLLAEHPPDRIVSFHQPLDLIDWDGPGEALARAMARVSSLPARKYRSQPGSLGSYAGLDLGIPVITVELPRSADRLDREEVWREYGPLLLEALRFDRSSRGSL